MDVPTFQFSACLTGAIFEVPWSIFCTLVFIDSRVNVFTEGQGFYFAVKIIQITCDWHLNLIITVQVHLKGK